MYIILENRPNHILNIIVNYSITREHINISSIMQKCIQWRYVSTRRFPDRGPLAYFMEKQKIRTLKGYILVLRTGPVNIVSIPGGEPYAA